MAEPMEGVVHTDAAAARRALEIPELLQMILQHADNSVRANSARVNRTWSQIALEELWYKLTRFSPLLRLLGETVTSSGGELVRSHPKKSQSSPLIAEQRFADGNLPSDWTRYDEAAQRVRILEVDERVERLSDEITMALTAARHAAGRRYLLPALTALRWLSGYRHVIPLPSLLFLPQSLRSLWIEIFGLPDDDLSRLVKMLAGLLPSGMKQIVILNRGNYTVHVTDGTIAMTGLEDMIFHQNQLDGFVLPTMCISRAMLQRLPSGLKTLGFRHQYHTHNMGLTTTLGVLPEHFSNLKTLSLVISVVDDALLDERFPFANLQPLLSIRTLQEFKLSSGVPLVLSEHDIRSMGEAWPKMESLTLWANAAPAGSFQATPVDRLVCFAAAFSTSLLDLSHTFYIENNVPKPDTVKHSFRRLKKLSFCSTRGLLRHSYQRPLASFLGILCPNGCKLYRHLGDGTGWEYDPLWTPTSNAADLSLSLSQSWLDLRVLFEEIQKVVKDQADATRNGS